MGRKTHRLLLAAALAASAGCGGIVDHFSGRTEACRILAIGKPATATVVRLRDTGTTINDDPVVEFVLSVQPADGGDAWEARTKALVSRLDVPQVQPGRVFPAKYDPQDRSRVALDAWDCDGKK